MQKAQCAAVRGRRETQGSEGRGRCLLRGPKGHCYSQEGVFKHGGENLGVETGG